MIQFNGKYDYPKGKNNNNEKYAATSVKLVCVTNYGHSEWGLN